MKLYDQRVSKNVSVSSAAFFANFIYVIIGMIFCFLEQFINPTGESYDVIFGIIEFIVVTVYWITINIIYFSRPGRTKSGTTITYLVFTNLPIIVFTVATIIIMVYFPTTEFQYSWNLLTWVVAPTLFWYLPFSYAYYSFGFYINLPTFLAIILVYIILLQIIGILCGYAWISRVQEKEAAKKRQRERLRQRRNLRPVTLERQEHEAEITVVTEPNINNKMYTGTNPFSGTKTDEKVAVSENLEVVERKNIDETDSKIVKVDTKSIEKNN